MILPGSGHSIHSSCYHYVLSEPLSPSAPLCNGSCGHYPTSFAYFPWGPVKAVEAAHIQLVGTVANGEGDRTEGTAGPVYLLHACAGRSLHTSEDFCHLPEVLKVQLDW